MRMVTFTAVLAVLHVGTDHAHARPQEPVITVDKCREPLQPLGYSWGSGIVRTVLSPDGIADTTQLEVGAAQGVSPAGLLSIATRQLSACRWRIDPKPKAPILVLQQLVMDTSGISIRTIPAEGRPFTALEITIPPIPSDTLPENDPRLEERPRSLGCKYTPRPGIRTGVPMRRSDLEAAARELVHANTGEVDFTFVVGPDGRFVSGSSSLVASTNPVLTQRAMQLYEDCQYAPGRVHGVPVATRLKGRLRAEVRIEGGP